jgi:hypothetical protein
MSAPTTVPVQSALNLMLQIKSGENANLIEYLAHNAATINDALNKVGTVHFARFLLIPNTNLLFVITEYDGSFNAYIEAFTALLGPVFDVLLSHMDPAPPLPVEENVQAFQDFVRKYNLPSNLYAAYPNCTVQQIWGKGCAKG